MERDRLIILTTDAPDPAYPGRRFYCWHCVLLEGVLTAFPGLAERVDVARVDWPRPREAVVALVGEANQDLPLLVLADDAPDDLATGRHGDRRFVAGKDAILRALHLRHGIPEPHP